MLLLLTGVLLALRYVVIPLVFWRSAESCERPQHQVIDVLDAKADGRNLRVEVRQYAPYLVAEVSVSPGLPDEQQRAEGFTQVAGYIFGGNLRRKSGLVGRWAPHWVATEKEPEKIAMTAPVQSEAQPDGMSGIATVSFTMPSKYRALNELPVPTNRNVTLRVVHEHFVAVAGFRGPPPTAEKVNEVHRAMLASVEQAGLQPLEGRGVQLYQYHDPFATPSLLRWNEVALVLDPHGLTGKKQEV